MPSLGRLRCQTLHTSDEIEADFDEFRSLIVAGRAGALPVCGRDAEFLVQFA
jgi:hypothetical protein